LPPAALCNTIRYIMKHRTYTVEVFIHASITVHAADANAAGAIAKARALTAADHPVVTVHGVEVGNMEVEGQQAATDEG